MSLRWKTGLGLLFTYASVEAYLHFQTLSLIKERKKEYDKLVQEDVHAADIDVSKFKSGTIAGMFVNPFEEYRPQTAFEFVAVRLMEVFEAIYGSYFEIHKQVPETGLEVEDILKPAKPNLELLEDSSMLFRNALKFSNLELFGSIPNAFKSLSTDGKVPPLASQVSFTWLGQSCSLIQISGMTFLTDPLLSKYLIHSRMGPKRLVDAPISKEDIARITKPAPEFVLVSHDHPDHLELDLVEYFGNATVWIVPLGLRKKLARKGVKNIIELDWWESVSLNEYITGGQILQDRFEVQCLPSMHWSGRYILDANKSLWGSFLIKKNGVPLIYHAGDTGYSEELFKTIGKFNKSVFLSLLPIGQYCPTWHQKPRHISPDEALLICKDISTDFMMGIHWGTFKLSQESILEPKNRLEALSHASNTSDQYRAPILGKTYVFDSHNKKEIKLR